MNLAADLAALLAIPFHPPTDAAALLQIALRWVHYLAAIVWVGLLYFFTLVNVPFMRGLEPELKPRIYRSLTMPALQWFRWASLVTVLAGIWFWMIEIGNNVRAAHSMGYPGASGGMVIGTFFGLWTFAWVVEFALLTPLKGPLNNGWVLGALIAATAAFIAYAFLRINDAPWLANNVLSIGVGGGIGWLMLLNVWGIIWRHNKKIIRGTLAGTPPENAATLARQALLASRVNFFLSWPMLFFMAAASHYPLLGR